MRARHPRDGTGGRTRIFSDGWAMQHRVLDAQSFPASGMPLIGSGETEPHVGQGCNKCLFSDAGGWKPRQRPKKPSYVVALSRPDLLPRPLPDVCWQRPLKRFPFGHPMNDLGHVRIWAGAICACLNLCASGKCPSWRIFSSRLIDRAS